MNHRTFLGPIAMIAGATVLAGCADAPIEYDTRRTFAAGMMAHHICAGVFVVGRDYPRDVETVIAEDISRFPDFEWGDDIRYDVERDAGLVTVTAPTIPDQRAKYNGDQGCSILPEDADDVAFQPVDVSSSLPDPATQPWPTGDADAHGDLPDAVRSAMAVVVDAAIADTNQNTRALVVTYRGKIVAEGYAPGFTNHTPQISWSMGKSMAATLAGVLSQQGYFGIHDPAPIPEWQQENDPRRAITIASLLNMSSGLDFPNYGIGPNNENSFHAENEHFRIYFDGIDVYRHAVDQPTDQPPHTSRRYRNSDPLSLMYVAKLIVEGRGDNFLEFPQHDLFDRIGIRNAVLETDAFGNFIITGYDYASAWDWTRLGLLHLWDGLWEGERILPEGWVDFVSAPARSDSTLDYGGLWWLNRGGAMPRAPDDAYWAAGFMGQRTIVIPSRDVVIVRLGPSARGFNGYINDVVGDILDLLPRSEI